MSFKIKQFLKSDRFRGFIKFNMDLILMLCVLTLIFGVVVNAFYLAISLYNAYPPDLSILENFKEVIFLSKVVI